MATPLSSIKTDVRNIIRETNAAKSFHSDELVRQMINLNYRRRCGQLIAAYEGYFNTFELRTVKANQTDYTWPVGFLRLEHLELVRSDGTLVPLQRFERHFYQFNPSDPADYDSYQPEYSLIGNGFRLSPPASVDITNGLRITYSYIPPALVDDKDCLHPDFPDSLFKDLIVLDTVIALLDSEGLLEMQAGMKSITRMRAELEVDFLAFAESRTLSQDEIVPFTIYHDA